MDVGVFNWQRAQGSGARTKLKAASAVVFVNSTAEAHTVIEAWVRVQTHGANLLAPDDQTLDLVFAQAGYASRARWGWLPHEYLPIAPRALAEGAPVVVRHDGGQRPGRHGNSHLKPKLLASMRAATAPPGSRFAVQTAGAA
jgi:hypothetical protein